MVSRRQYLATFGSCLGVTSTSGCLGILPGDDDSTQSYPGGTVVVENTGDSAVAATVTVVEDEYDASLDTSIDGGERVVEREFVTADLGAVVTLAARLGDDGEPKTFQFLPAGGDDTPPEVARLGIRSDVEASATWTATHGN